MSFFPKQSRYRPTGRSSRPASGSVYGRAAHSCAAGLLSGNLVGQVAQTESDGWIP